MKKCIFCETQITKSNKSNEHVIPRWIIERIHPEYTKFIGKHTSFPNNPEVIFNQRDQSFNSLVLGNVCKECNTKWMSKLENETKPILLAILDDRSPVILTREQCLTLSKWAFKTAITLNYSVNYKKIIPLTHANFYYLNNEIPKDVKVDLAFCKEVNIRQLIGGNKKVIHSNDYTDKFDILNKSYITTIQFDHLLIRVAWTPDPKVSVVQMPFSSVYRIHPQEDEEFIIQVIRGGVFRDISQFHFVGSSLVEDGIYKGPLDFD